MSAFLFTQYKFFMQNIHIGLLKILQSSGTWKLKLRKLLDWSVGTVIAFLVFPKPQIEKFPAYQRPGGIGDAVFLLPILNIIKEQHPNVRVDILCEKRNVQIFTSQSDLCDGIYCYDEWNSFSNLLRNQYDIIFDTEQWHYLSALVAYFLPSKLTVGFVTRPLRKKLFHRHIPYDMDGYELDNFKKLFEGILGRLDNISDIDSCYKISSEALSWAQAQNIGKSVTVFLGASIPERRLTHDQSLELIHALLEKDLKIILLGGRDVKNVSLQLEKEIHNSRLVNFVDKIALEKNAALMKESKLFIGTDSGLMHLACAVGTPVIAIFGPGNLKKWGPKGEKHTIITEDVECSPCTQFGYTVPTCRGSYHCMREIAMNQIFNIIDMYNKKRGNP